MLSGFNIHEDKQAIGAVLLLISSLKRQDDQKMFIKRWTTQIAKFRGANMGPTWVQSAPDGPNVGPINLAIRETLSPTSPRSSQTQWSCQSEALCGVVSHGIRSES